MGAPSRPPGRPTKRTKAALGRLYKAIALGLSQASACVVSGISVSALRNWRSEDPAISDGMEKARETARQEALAIIKSAAIANKEWRAASEWLKLSYGSDYRQAGGGITINNQLAVVVSEDKRQELIQRRQQMLEKS